MINIDMTVNALNDVLGAADSVGSRSTKQQSSVGGLLDARISISILGFDDLFSENLRRSKIYPGLGNEEPLVDIIKYNESVRVVVHFPGLKKEDVSYEIREGLIELGIKERGQIKHVAIPWDVKPSRVRVTSTHNNSVFELTFKKI